MIFPTDDIRPSIFCVTVCFVIYYRLKIMDSRLRGNDINGPNSTFCETIKIELGRFVSAVATLIPVTFRCF